MTASSRPIAALLGDGRLHLHHGPIDLVIGAQAQDRHQVAVAYRAAARRMEGLLDALVAELALLRAPVADTFPALRGPVARRMAHAVWPFRNAFDHGFITPMAAVAGSVADEILAAMRMAAAITAEHAAIRRKPAHSVRDDSDLGGLAVVVDVGPLPAAVIAQALDRGAAVARALRAQRRIHAAYLQLQGACRIITPNDLSRMLSHDTRRHQVA